MSENVDLTLEIKDALEIDESNLLEELRRHSAKLFYYGVTWARAARQQRKIHLKVKEIESRLMNELRQRMTVTDSKNKVSAEIKVEYLNGHPEYLAAMQEDIQATYMEEVLGITKDAMRQRGLALNELARHYREEKMYGDEFKAMETEFDERIEEKKKRHRRTKAEIVAEKQNEILEVTPVYYDGLGPKPTGE